MVLVFIEDGWIRGRRIVDKPEPPLPGAPTAGAETEVARGLADRLRDVRIAAAILCGVAEQAELTIANEPALFGRLVPARPWTKPAIAALEPLKMIVQACDAFEDAIAGPQILPNDMRDIPADIARSATFAVPIAKEDQIVDRRVTPGAGARSAASAPLAMLPDQMTREKVAKVLAAAEAVRPYIEAVDRLAPALATIEAARPYVQAIERVAPLVDAVDALGPHARFAPLSDAELADLDRAGRTLPRGRAGELEEATVRRLAEARKQEKDLH